MDLLWLAIAFMLGLVARVVRLPPLVGFLAAGFLLRAMGVESSAALERMAEVGVILLLFSIGLKLRLASLLGREVWGGASVHMAITVVVFGAASFGLARAGLGAFTDLGLGPALLLAFALSFSSTVFAVKVLEEQGAMPTLYGRVAIGILIVQDLLAVLFLTASTGVLPSPWALSLLVLIPARPLLRRFLDISGHGELLVLLGLLIPIGGATLFERVGLKPDLGAIVLGVLLAGSPKADELATAMLSFKDLFLVGFFLEIGLSSTPTAAALGVATLLVLAVPLKVGLFLVLLCRFRLRARTSMMASFSLANYSEFGLIVVYVGVANGWIGAEWKVILAIAVALTFVAAAPLNAAAVAICGRFGERLGGLETAARHPEEQPIDPGDARVVVFGLGRVGASAYDAMAERQPGAVLGIDIDPEAIAQSRAAGRSVIQADATDAGFWRRAQSGQIELVMLAMSNAAANGHAATQVRASGFRGRIAAVALHDDEIAELEAAGVDEAFSFSADAGRGFAEHVCDASRP